MGANGNAGQAVVAGVRDLLPVLRERAQEAEDARVVPADSVKALAETGFFRLLQPARFGGLRGRPGHLLHRRPADRQRLRVDRLGGLGARRASLAARRCSRCAAQEEVWGADPATRMSSSYAPTGRAEAEPTAATGSPGGGASPPAATTPPGCCSAASWWTTAATRWTSARSCCPSGDYTIDDVWDTVGLRGTGSNDIVVDDVFVPEHRSLSFTDVARCAGARARRPTPAPLYRLPYGSVFSYAITDADHRHGGRRLRRARGLPARAGARLLRRAEGGRGPVRAGPGRRRRRPRSTRPGWRWSGT